MLEELSTLQKWAQPQHITAQMRDSYPVDKCNIKYNSTIGRLLQKMHAQLEEYFF